MENPIGSLVIEILSYKQKTLLLYTIGWMNLNFLLAPVLNDKVSIEKENSSSILEFSLGCVGICQLFILYKYTLDGFTRVRF